MKRPLSLGVRLGLWCALIAAVASAVLGAYLYRSFEQQLRQRDDVQLLGKLRQLRQLLGHSGTQAMLRSQTEYLRDTMSGESNALIEIHAAPADGGGLLLAINPVGLALPQLPPVAVQREATVADIRHWSSPAGAPAAAVNAWARLGDATVEIRLARLYPEREALLAGYRRHIVAASLGAGGLAAVLVLWLIWRGMAPLRRLQAQTAVIGPQSLALRLDASDTPAELHALVHGLNAMLARLESGYARLNQFAADLAHELRTPLATLTGQSQVMLSRPRTEAEHARLLESQLLELERLNRMVDSLLFLARGEHQAQNEPLRCQHLSGTEELARQADYFTDLAEERGVRIVCHGDAPVWAEPQLLRRALANLLSNAVRHARPGSVVELRAAAGANAAGAVLEVVNEGEPVPPESLPRLFDRFYRADPARSGEGNGLGLSIVRAIMVRHGGEAEVWQTAGRIGFRLTLPGPVPAAAGTAPAGSVT
ncbi:MAG TPA: heavy metal sensor histidine kinase [Archangium sp.]|uniref:heavy metal sensor histidine kinase n=1 Tax=Archangium sp. TaxID=1872627 RepID=UPI002E314198|nr:heavy metal sensor histidine kinase [Archangium sp.]HEX5749583.1 heavy metal sensor histidine kinase [Archangium sp.]